jgi:hypothetical protein
MHLCAEGEAARLIQLASGASNQLPLAPPNYWAQAARPSPKAPAYCARHPERNLLSRYQGLRRLNLCIIHYPLSFIHDPF